MKHDDVELVSQTLTGNQDAFGKLVRRYQGLVFGLAYHRVKNAQDAEDIAQDAFLSAYINLKQLRKPEKFGSWLRQIATNLCRAYQQRRSYEAKGIQLFDPTLSDESAESDRSELTIRLQRGKRIRGVVTDSESGEPVQGAWVTYFNSTQPYTIDDEVLPQHIPTGKRILPLGGEAVCTEKDGEFEITTAQESDNYLVINAPGYNSGVISGYGKTITHRLTPPLEYVPMVIGPVEVTGDELFLPISFKLTKKSDFAP